MVLLQTFMGPGSKPHHSYIDNDPGLVKAMDELKWLYDTSTPNRSESNGVIERANRVVKEGTSCTLVQSGFDEAWWPEAMSCFCFLKNASDLLADEKTAYSRRFGQEFRGPLIPFGAEVTYKPITAKDKARCHEFGEKKLSALFVGYDQQRGGGWSDDLWVADMEQIGSAELHSEIHPKRFRAEEVEPVLRDGHFKFPLAEGALRQPGSDPRSRPKGPRKYPTAKGNLGDKTETQEKKSNKTPPAEETKQRDYQVNLEYGLDSDEETDAATHPSSAPVQDILSKDYWEITDDAVMVHHVTPRVKLYMPTAAECPVPLKYIDCRRNTTTSLDIKVEKWIMDFWTKAGERELSEQWTGKTVFPLLRPPSAPGYQWVSGRPTRIKEGERPEHLWPEAFWSLGKTKRKEAVEEGKVFSKELREARAERGITEVSADDKDYFRILSEAKVKLGVPAAPAMPLLERVSHNSQLDDHTSGYIAAAKGNLGIPKSAKTCSSKPHQDHTSMRGYSSETFLGMVHTPVDIKKALQIPDARKALDAEWAKLVKRGAWDVRKVRPKAEVIAEARSTGVPAHFGSLRDLCHIKNSQLGEEFWTYKGRVVFRGDIVRNEQGDFAVFAEQGASASHMAAAKFMDAVSRLPGNAGQDSDAVGAYTQVKLEDAAKILGVPGLVTKTWISLPIYQHPSDGSWKDIIDPVVPLELNLYGHPLAGLLWEKYQESILLKLGFEKVTSWECLYVHRDKQLFLSGYVDDYKMAGTGASSLCEQPR